MLPILLRDDRFVVLNKPPGLPVHPGPRGGASVEDWFPALSRRRGGPWLAHRLDTDTAGCLVVALRRAALLAAQVEFAAGRAHKTYWAVVRGAPAGGDTGTIEAALERRSGPAGWHMVPDPRGKPAVTDWRVLGCADGLTWLALVPHTGRTHQIRVHCAALLGCPVLGDPVYGGGSGGGGSGGGGSLPLQLLARAITLDLDPPVAATAPPPPTMHDALASCGWRAGAAAVAGDPP